MLSKERKYLGLALAESAKSTYERVKIGAVIVNNGKVVGKGANLSTSHPLQRKYNDMSRRIAPAHALHAEMHAIVKAGSKCHGATIYVARIDRRGLWAQCKPCPACALAIKLAGIKLVVHTTPTGVEKIWVS